MKRFQLSRLLSSELSLPSNLLPSLSSSLPSHSLSSFIFLRPQANFLTTRGAFFFLPDGQCLSNRSRDNCTEIVNGFSVAGDPSTPKCMRRMHSVGGNMFLYLSFCISRRSPRRRVKTYVRIFSRYFTRARTLSMESGIVLFEDKILRNGYSFSVCRSAFWVVYFSRHSVGVPLFKFWNFAHP